MEVLEIVLPVLAMIILGILCRKWKLLDQSGVNNMKTLVTNIMLPVGNFSCTGNSRVQWKDRNSGSDHVCDALDFIWDRILDEKIYGRAI